MGPGAHGSVGGVAVAKINTGIGWTGTPQAGEFYVPAGGEAGYHLVKMSDTDGAYDWMAPPTMPPGSMEGVWRWQATPVVGVVDVGVVGVDSDDPRAGTLLTINLADMDGNDRTAMFEGVSPDDTITFTVVGASQSWHRYGATGDHQLVSTGSDTYVDSYADSYAPAAGGYYQIPVITVDGSATGTEPLTGTEVVVVVDRQAPALPGPAGPPGPAGSEILFEGVWAWTNKTTDASQNGQVGNDVSDWASATLVNIAERTSNNTDASLVFSRLGAGDGLGLQQQNDASRYCRYDLTGPGVDNGTWWAFPVSLSSVGSSGPTPGGNNATVVRLLGAALTSFVYNQATPEAVWTINHGLGFYPNAMVTDSGGSEVIGDVTQTDTTTMTLTFSAAFAGTAYLS